MTSLKLLPFLATALTAVFMLVFSSGDGSYTENQSREVYIDDVRPEVMREFLHFLYTGTLDKQQPNPPQGEFLLYKQLIIELIHLAEKYQVPIKSILSSKGARGKESGKKLVGKERGT